MRILFIVVALFYAMPDCFSQHINLARGTNSLVLTAEEGYLNGAAKGISYQMIINTDDYSAMIDPSVSGLEEGLLMKFVLESDKDSSVTIDFALPTKLYGGGGEIFCSFGNISCYWASTNTFWNPVLGPINFISTGRDSFYLGINITIPPNVMADSYYGDIICSVERQDTTAAADAIYSVEVISPPLTVTMLNNGGMEYLSNGQNYTLSPKDSVVQPKQTGLEIGIPLGLEITGDPYATVVVIFALPTKLLHEGSDSISSSFSSTSLYNIEADNFTNPNDAFMIVLNADGEAFFRIGISIVIPHVAPPGNYAGVLLCIAQYVGGPSTQQNKILSNHQEIGTFNVTVGGPNYVRTDPSHITEYRLEQNYPNPLNPSTTIRFELPRESFVILKVYNVLGQEVETLVNEKKEAGRYEVDFDGAKLASGQYIYKLQSGDFMSSKKLLLLK